MKKSLEVGGGLVKSVDFVEMPSTFEGLLNSLRLILSKPFIQSLVLEVDSPIKVTWFRDPEDSLSQKEPQETPETVLGRIRLEEFTGQSASFKELLVDALIYIDQSGLFATHMLVGSIGRLKDFVGLPRMMTLPRVEGSDGYNFLGTHLAEVASLPEDVVLILGANLSDASLSEAEVGIKLVL